MGSEKGRYRTCGQGGLSLNMLSMAGPSCHVSCPGENMGLPSRPSASPPGIPLPEVM